MKSSTHALGSGTKKFNEKYSLHETNRYLTICTLLLKWFIRFLFSLRYVSLLMMTLAIYYYYLNSLYLIDEVAQVDRLRELMLYEKTTILVKADNKNEKTVKSFVEYYSLCRSVHEIVVVWDQQQSPPLVPSYFTFAHTHSKVKFHHIGESSLSGTSYSQFMYDHRLVDTESK